jgi:hypothetical protein
LVRFSVNGLDLIKGDLTVENGTAQFISNGTSSGITITGDNSNIDRIQANGTNGIMSIEATDEIDIGNGADYVKLEADTIVITNGLRFGDGLGAGTFLNEYDTASFACTLTTTYLTAQQVGRIKYVRVGDNVTLVMPAISGTSNSSDLVMNLGGMPDELIPENNQMINVVITDNGYTKAGAIRFDVTTEKFYFHVFESTTGTLSDVDFTSSGTKGFSYETPFTYKLN